MTAESLKDAVELVRNMFADPADDDPLPMVVCFSDDLSTVEVMGLVGLNFADMVYSANLPGSLVAAEIVVTAVAAWTYPEYVMQAVIEGAGADPDKIQQALQTLYNVSPPSAHPDRITQFTILGGRRSTKELYCTTGYGERWRSTDDPLVNRLGGRQPEAMRALMGIAMTDVPSAGPLDPDDDQIIRRVARLYETVDPVPDDLIDHLRTAVDPERGS